MDGDCKNDEWSVEKFANKTYANIWLVAAAYCETEELVASLACLRSAIVRQRLRFGPEQVAEIFFIDILVDGFDGSSYVFAVDAFLR